MGEQVGPSVGAAGVEALEVLRARAGRNRDLVQRDRRRPDPRHVGALLCAVMLVAGVVAWRWVGRPAPIEDRMPMATAPTGASEPTGEHAAQTSLTSPEHPGSDTAASGDGEVVVHVVGAVLAPGVVRLDSGARVVDAVVAAGGLAQGADTARVNLAAPLLDGSRIVVPVVGQEVPVEVPTSVAAVAVTDGTSGGSSGGGALVDLNTATAQQLDSLPGVGPATAEAILAHRDSNGPFTSVEQLLDVRGIGQAKLDSLRDLVVVR